MYDRLILFRKLRNIAVMFFAGSPQNFNLESGTIGIISVSLVNIGNSKFIAPGSREGHDR